MIVSSVVSRIELHKSIFWHSDPGHAFLRKRASIPVTAGFGMGFST